MHIENTLSRMQGIGGALGGAVIGMLSIVVFFEFSFLSACSGLILALSTFYGYALFAREHNKSGITFCLLLNFIAPLPALLLLHSFSRMGIDLMIPQIAGIYFCSILGSVWGRNKLIELSK